MLRRLAPGMMADSGARKADGESHSGEIAFSEEPCSHCPSDPSCVLISCRHTIHSESSRTRPGHAYTVNTVLTGLCPGVSEKERERPCRGRVRRITTDCQGGFGVRKLRRTQPRAHPCNRFLRALLARNLRQVDIDEPTLAGGAAACLAPGGRVAATPPATRWEIAS